MSVRFVVSRASQTFVTVIVVVSVVMLVLAIIPGDPAREMLGQYASDEQVQRVRERLGLDQPLYVRYIRYLTDLFQGKLGFSYHYQVPVVTLIGISFGRPIRLVALAFVLSLVIGIPVGVVSAVRHYSLFDYAVRLTTYIGICIPVFILGILLLFLLAVWIPVFPVAVSISGDITIQELALPALTLAVYNAVAIARITRSAMLDVIRQDYIVTARAKGLAESYVILKHALRNALISIETYIGIQFGMFLGGSMVTESVFAYPGMGILMLNGISTRDYPLIQGCVVIFALSFILVNLIVDFTYALIDPRMRGR